MNNSNLHGRVFKKLWENVLEDVMTKVMSEKEPTTYLEIAKLPDTFKVPIQYLVDYPNDVIDWLNESNYLTYPRTR